MSFTLVLFVASLFLSCSVFCNPPQNYTSDANECFYYENYDDDPNNTPFLGTMKIEFLHVFRSEPKFQADSTPLSSIVNDMMYCAHLVDTVTCLPGGWINYPELPFDAQNLRLVGSTLTKDWSDTWGIGVYFDLTPWDRVTVIDDYTPDPVLSSDDHDLWLNATAPFVNSVHPFSAFDPVTLVLVTYSKKSIIKNKKSHAAISISCCVEAVKSAFSAEVNSRP